MRYQPGFRRGGASVLAVFFVTLFAVLSMSYVGMTQVNMRMSDNHQKMSQTHATAESGLEYAGWLLTQYRTDDAYKSFTSTFYGTFTSTNFQTIFDQLRNYLNDATYSPILNLLNGQVIPAPTAFSDALGDGRSFTLPSIKLNSGDEEAFVITFKQYDAEPSELYVESAGADAGSSIDRRVRLSYHLDEDTSILDYAVFSRSRVIMTGDSTINGDIFSSWAGVDYAPPFEVSSPSTVNGDISVSVSESDWDGSTVDSGTYENIVYDQPEIDLYDADDFDTTIYFNETSKIKTSGNIGQIDEYFPHAPGDYSSPAEIGQSAIHRKVFEGNNYTDASVQSGNDVLFRDCVFNGILYIGSTGDGNQTNNVRFENCTFNGPIVTNVPTDFTSETWKKNVLYFTGNSVFNNSSSWGGLTILAPNYNVNIGNTQSVESATTNTIEGLVVGGVVDLRGNVSVEGTILSISDPEETFGSEEIGTNLGFSGENSESSPDAALDGTISVTSNPDNSLPIGVRVELLMQALPNSYVEL